MRASKVADLFMFAGSANVIVCTRVGNKASKKQNRRRYKESHVGADSKKIED